MPAVELLLARQAAGKHTITVGGSLPVTFMPGSVMTGVGDIIAQMSFAGGILTVPFQWCIYNINNTDSTDAMIVRCASGDPGVRVLGGYTAVVFCDGMQVTFMTTQDVEGYVIGVANGFGDATAEGVSA